MPNRKLYSERTNLWTVLGAIAIGVIGLLLLYSVDNVTWFETHSNIRAILRELGGLLLASVTIAFLWELFAKRAFLAELLAKARLAEEVRTAGIIGVPRKFYIDIDWPHLIGKVTEFDIFFAYGRTWRANNEEELRGLAKRRGVKVRVVLPDPENAGVMAELARRFFIPQDEARARVQEAITELAKIFTRTDGAVAQFSLWLLPAAPLFSFYRLDHMAVITLPRHREERGGIPTFLVEEGGDLYDFVRREFDSFVDEKTGTGKHASP